MFLELEKICIPKIVDEAASKNCRRKVCKKHHSDWPKIALFPTALESEIASFLDTGSVVKSSLVYLMILL